MAKKLTIQIFFSFLLISVFSLLPSFKYVSASYMYDGKRTDYPSSTPQYSGNRDFSVRDRQFTTIKPKQISDSQCQFFPETLFSVCGDFVPYWRAGGLMNIGYPITEVFERRLDDGTRQTVQYFERQRLEIHSENNPPYNVLGGLVGVEDAERRGLLQTTPFQPLPFNTKSSGQCQFFPETKHQVCHGFLNYWKSNGYDFKEEGISFSESLALLGYPISEEFSMTMDDGKVRTVQYFERARMEMHSENQPPFDILLGRLGAELSAK